MPIFYPTFSYKVPMQWQLDNKIFSVEGETWDILNWEENMP